MTIKPSEIPDAISVLEQVLPGVCKFVGWRFESVVEGRPIATGKMLDITVKAKFGRRWLPVRGRMAVNLIMSFSPVTVGRLVIQDLMFTYRAELERQWIERHGIQK